MAIVVVGGHTRNIGKTSVVAGLIARMPEGRWTAIKITQFGHGVCSANGEPCDCDTGEHTVAISEERPGRAALDTDSGRYLLAGALRSLWVRTRQGQLADAMPRVRREIAEAPGHVIIESNSILRFLRPDVYLSVLDPAVVDFKESARHFLDRADGVLVLNENLRTARWKAVSLKLLERAAILPIRPPEYVNDKVVTFLRERLGLYG